MPEFKDGYSPSKDDLDNRSNQLNPNNDAYWNARADDEDYDDGYLHNFDYD